MNHQPRAADMQQPGNSSAHTLGTAGNQYNLVFKRGFHFAFQGAVIVQGL